MPKSRHRKDHKKKVTARRERLENRRKNFYNKLREQFGEELAKELSKENNLTDKQD
jgi:hypothetical protein